MEFLPGAPVCPETVVSRALLRIPEHLIGLADPLEFLLRVRLVADIRMIIAGKLSIGALDLVL